MRRVLFVCTGNICRSPSADGVFRHHVKKLGLEKKYHVDSAGTHGYHIDEPPDSRTVHTAKTRGYDLSMLRGRQVAPTDFDEFDFIFAMDKTHLSQLQRLQPKGSKAMVELYLLYAGITEVSQVPDPYYGKQADFEHVLDLVEQATEALLKRWGVYD